MAHWLLLGLLLVGCGKQGDRGEKGDKGDAGPVTGVSVASGFSCSKVSGAISVQYMTVLFTSGDRWVNCSIENSTGKSSSDSAIYKAGLLGTTTGSCIVVYDIDSPATYGWWNFTINGTVARTVFNKTGSANNQMTIAVDSCSYF